MKQARHRASRRFLKDGARSSLPQYLQTNFSAFAVPFGGCGVRRADFFVSDGGVAFRVVVSPTPDMGFVFAFM
ncbi:MAG TPA: hypothetical protein VMU16_02715 [Candidatus Binataceae bacterium]|nr:hypothetical protein [Candidatus Binataceae bacterium]